MRFGATVAALLLVAACVQGPAVPTEPPAGDEDAPRGGTLRVALLSTVSQGQLDPASEDRHVDTNALHRCCLSRTLLSYNGLPTAEGGAEPQPDLAEGLPEVSADELSWTFKLRFGLRYGPPLSDLEIKAADVIRGIERSVLLDEFVRKELSMIHGVAEFADGSANTVAGLQAPDDHTLVVRLQRPAGDLGYRLSFSGSAPIPPAPSGARLGIADGHDEDWGGYIVSSGPYMIEGAELIDFALPSEQRRPAPGYEPGTSLVLVRNPSWDPESDRLRAAYPDRIEFTIRGVDEVDHYARLVEQGQVDLLAHLANPPQVPLDHVEDPALRGRIHFNDRNVLRSITMNVAVPPFDDVHVRRAVSLAIDKAGMIELAGGPSIGRVAGHLIPDAFLNNLLFEYDPYSTLDGRGDLERAREEMRKSRYDTNGDGLCDAPLCSGVSAVTFAAPPYPAKGQLVAENLRALGIELHLEELPTLAAFAAASDPANRLAMFIGISWLGGTTASFRADLLTSAALRPADNVNNFSLLGATPEQLTEWGYEVTDVPSVDERVEACKPIRGHDQLRCWAQLDQYVMEEVVPWVPYVFENFIAMTSERVVAYSFDQVSTLPAFDRLAIRPDDR